MTISREFRPWVQLAVITFVFRGLSTTVWAFLPRHNPITQWLLHRYAGSNDGIYYSLVFFHDAIVNVLLALPFAYLIVRIKPDRRWLYVAALVFAMFLWDYRIVLFERRDFFDFISSSWRTIVGFVTYVMYFPAAILFLSMIEQRGKAKE